MMFRVPTQGFALSVEKHNGRLDIQADWVEASALFATERISRSDIVDALLENNSYKDQEFANERVSNIFAELDRRFRLLGKGGALVQKGNRIQRVADWQTRPAYAFCVALGMLPHYRDEVVTHCGKDYTEQGELFELLCVEAFEALRWRATKVGWSRVESSSIEDKVADLATSIGEPVLEGAHKRWTEPQAKDDGLDIVVWLPYDDGWGGRPVCLVQCASGENWRDKLTSPNIDTWQKLIDFSTKPRKGLVMPFAPDSDEFRRKANTDLLMLLKDRHRLLAPNSNDADTIPSGMLAKKIIKWTKKRIACFPTDSD